MLTFQYYPLSQAVRSVSVLAGGFVQIAPRSLGQEAELLFSFYSNNQSGVLLAAFSNDRTQRHVRQTDRRHVMTHLYTRFYHVTHHVTHLDYLCAALPVSAPGLRSVGGGAR